MSKRSEFLSKTRAELDRILRENDLNNFVEVNNNVYLRISLYSLSRQTDSTSKLIKALDFLRKNELFSNTYDCEKFDIYYSTGCYGDIDGIYIEFIPIR